MKTKFNFYRTISKYFRFTLLVAGVLYVLTTTSGCKKDNNTNTENPITYSLSDLNGTWQRHSLVTSSSNNGYWIYATIVNNEGLSTVHYIFPNGNNKDSTYVGVDASMTSDGIITSASDHAAHSYLSSDKKLMVGTTKRGDLYTLVFDQKTVSGTIYSSADFQGTWQNHYLVGGVSWSGWVHAVSVMDNTGSGTSSAIVKSDGNSDISSG